MRCSCETKLGYITVAEKGGFVTEVSFSKCTECDKSDLLDKAFCEIFEYLDNKRRKFDLPVLLSGTPFQKSVWNELLNIEYGQTKSYSQIAKNIGNEKASRAVGMACNKNPVAIIVPCHRVVGINGSLTGFAGGIQIKEKLLTLEGGMTYK